MSWSNSRSSVFERLKIVTCEPRPENTWPISTAMNPPPMMPSRFGSSGSRMIESDVWNPVSISPAIGGTTGRAPAASRMFGAVIRRPSTSRVCSSTKSAVPSINVTFGVPVAR